METIALTTDQEKIMALEVNPLVASATALVVSNQAESMNAQNLLKEIKAKAKAIGEKMHPPVEAAHASWKAALKLEQFFSVPFQEAEGIIKMKVIGYENEQERIRQNEARAAEAKRQELERKEREKLEAKAAAAAEKGNTEKAQALLEQAACVVIPPLPVLPPSPRVDGTAFRKVWKGEVVDMKALVHAISLGNAPLGLVMINQTALNNYAKAVQDMQKVAGVNIWQETQMAVRA